MDVDAGVEAKIESGADGRVHQCDVIHSDYYDLIAGNHCALELNYRLILFFAYRFV